MKTISFRIKNPRLARRLKRAAISLLILFSLMGLITVFMAYYYEDTVKHVIIDELNKRLNTEIVVENVERDIQFSVFKDFPYASVTFHNVAIMDAVKPPKKKGKQIALFTQWTKDRVEENKFINRVREAVVKWRTGRYVDITKTTGRLLDYWKDPKRERKLFSFTSMLYAPCALP